MTEDRAIEIVDTLIACFSRLSDNAHREYAEALYMASEAMRFKQEFESRQPFECEHEACEFNSGPICRLPDGWKCPHDIRQKSKPRKGTRRASSAGR